ncbi:putative small protein [Rubellimicrobium thermophilum DSM 16684]|uniref:Putative small protein n=1 Tax=Rubellimicrobium thermophilum DSM 16684 TaxID=1123069 RepID=S9SJR4_9RHOB|nr:DUF1127 domain-containing protein [Rubellimicrobium thermophilum]EPX86569.1 putative small protein [Rubellimicrobium thermophilum DSM 16684]
MAFVTQTSRSIAAGTFGARLAAMWQGLSERVARHRLYRQTLNELSALSDRDLADLGLHRSQIADVAAEAAYGAR